MGASRTAGPSERSCTCSSARRGRGRRSRGSRREAWWARGSRRGAWWGSMVGGGGV